MVGVRPLIRQRDELVLTLYATVMENPAPADGATLQNRGGLIVGEGGWLEALDPEDIRQPCQILDDHLRDGCAYPGLLSDNPLLPDGATAFFNECDGPVGNPAREQRETDLRHFLLHTAQVLANFVCRVKRSHPLHLSERFDGIQVLALGGDNV